MDALQMLGCYQSHQGACGEDRPENVDAHRSEGKQTEAEEHKTGVEQGAVVYGQTLNEFEALMLDIARFLIREPLSLLILFMMMLKQNVVREFYVMRTAEEIVSQLALIKDEELPRKVATSLKELNAHGFLSASRNTYCIEVEKFYDRYTHAFPHAFAKLRRDELHDNTADIRRVRTFLRRLQNLRACKRFPMAPVAYLFTADGVPLSNYKNFELAKVMRQGELLPQPEMESMARVEDNGSTSKSLRDSVHNSPPHWHIESIGRIDLAAEVGDPSAEPFNKKK